MAAFVFDCVAALSNVDLSDEKQTERVCVEIQNFIISKSKSTVLVSNRDRRVFKENGLKLFHIAFENADKMRPDLHAQLRAHACNLVALSYPETSEASVHYTSDDYILLIKMHMRTGKAFADAITSSDGMGANFSSADQFFESAVDYWRKALLMQSNFAEHNADVGFSLFSWRAEVLWNAKKFDKALDCAKEAIGFLNDSRAQPEALAFSKALYNKGVILFNNENFQAAIEWLKMSCNALELVKDSAGIKEKQSRSYRVLALAYMEAKQYEEALKAIEASITHFSSSDSLFVRTKLYYLLQRETEAQDSLFECLSHSNTSVQMGLSICEFAATHSSGSSFMQGFDKLQQKYPHEQGVIVSKFRVLISKNMFTEAATMLETVSVDEMSKNILSDLLVACWSTAVSFFEDKNYQQCCEWLLRCRRLLKSDDVTNEARCCRALSLASFEMGQLSDALDWAQKAKQCEGAEVSSASILHALRALILQERQDDALKEIERLLQSKDFSADDLTIIAEDSLLHNCPSITINALELLVKCSPEYSRLAVDVDDLPKDIPQPQTVLPQSMSQASVSVSALNIFVVLRNLVRLSIAELAPLLPPDSEEVAVSMDDDTAESGSAEENKSKSQPKFDLPLEKRYLIFKLVRYFELALHLTDGHNKSDETLDHIRYFGEQAWNMGLRTAKLQYLNVCYRFFDHSYTFLEKLPRSPKLLTSLKLALVLGAASTLEAAWITNDERVKKELGRDACNRIAKCLKLAQCETVANDKAIPLCRVLDIKARLFLEDENLVQTVKTLASKNEGITARMMDTIASLSMQFHRIDVCIAALQESLRLYMSANTVDYASVSRLYRMLIQLSPPVQSLKYYDEILRLTTAPESGEVGKMVPRIEAQWLISSAWNQGVLNYRLRKYQEAEKYMSRALQFHKLFLPENKVHLAEMNNSYSFVLECMNEK